MWRIQRRTELTAGLFFFKFNSGDGFFLTVSGASRLPFNLSCEYGLAMTHSGGYGWLSTANGVWRTSLAETILDISDDINRGKI